MQRIDAHIHFNAVPEDDALLKKLDLKLMNICVAGEDQQGWRAKQAEPYEALARREPGIFGWCTSFSAPEPGESKANYVEHAIAQLQRDFAQGAVACKVWKNIGMELKDQAGRCIMIDDEIFAPILVWLEKAGHPVLMHIGEPWACWQPLTVDSPHKWYYTHYPKWHMHGRTDVPDHAAQMASRDHVLQRHPRLNLIGAHLGSLEYDLKEVGRRLDRYPNFAVDTGGRLADLAWKEPETVRQFLEKYQDRVLWGTDMIINSPAMSPGDREKMHDYVQETWAVEHTYFTTGERVKVAGREVSGIGLSAALQEKIFAGNAQRWYPGL